MTPAFDVVCVGEALVDFLPDKAGQRVRDVQGWIPCSGGSPANVAVGLARLGARSAMLGVVGQDELGHFLVERLAAEGVDVSHLRQTDEGKTGLVFISLTATGERSFSFYRTRSAELFLARRDLEAAFLASARVIHLGTNSLLFPEARAAVLGVAKDARAAGRIVSSDPNLRLHMWPDPGELKALLGQLLPCCAVVKLSEEEIEFVTGQREPEAALAELAKWGVPLPIVTLAERGALFRWNGQVVHAPAPSAQVVDSTGAGDGFVSGLLYGVTRRYADLAELQHASAEGLRELVTFGCAVGARVVEKLGAVAGLPRRDEVQALLPR
ncbi:MAG TPA: carbohydrate kinase [Myxococcaceae bacterium]|nr:carbohydrate kinase [Myxococcaceae bacterium]